MAEKRGCRVEAIPLNKVYLVIVMCDIDDMNIYRDISAYDMI